MSDETELASNRQENARYAADYQRRLAADIVAMLPADPEEARRVLAIAHAMLIISV